MRITHFILTTLLVLLSQNLIAQDTIVKKDDSRISAKITEVHNDEIHYKKFNNLEGPTYVIETAKITSIIYENGEVETYDVKPAIANSSSGWQKQSEQTYTEEIEHYSGKFYYHNRRIGVNKLRNIIYKQGDPEAIHMWKSYKVTQGVAYGLGFAAIPVGVIAYSGAGFSIEPGWQILFVGGGIIVCNLLGLANHVMRVMYKNKRFRAVELYNEALNQKPLEEGDYY